MKQQLQENQLPEFESTEGAFLILHNDDLNTFDFVIDSLMEVCEHDEIQAEQCALITHHKGKCDVKKGEVETLEVMKDSLKDKGLIASVEL